MRLPPATHLLYLHGFRSSPQSAKARLVEQWLRERRPDIEWWCPQLPPSPLAAIDLVMRGISEWPRDSMAVIGSSLGGFYATYVAGMTRCRAALLNPAVHPARDLARHIGQLTLWHDPSERFYFRPEYVSELEGLDIGPLTRPERIYAIVAKGDEVLDWREMSARYPESRVQILDGGDHALTHFAQDHLEDVMSFVCDPS